jgi:hypothetical protein
MKTVKKGSEIKRVKDIEAEKLVKSNGYVYVPKSEWKSVTRVTKVTETTEEKPTKKPSKKKN